MTKLRAKAPKGNVRKPHKEGTRAAPSFVRNDADAPRDVEELRDAIDCNPLRALFFLARAYRARAGSDGPDGQAALAVARTLYAIGFSLQNRDAEALEALEALEGTARRCLASTSISESIDRKTGMPHPILGSTVLPSRVDAARELVGYVGARRSASAEDLAFWVVGWLLIYAEAAGFGPPAVRDLDNLDQRIAAEINKVWRRSRFTNEHIAIAILVGWGMKRDAARNTFRKA